MWIFDDFAKKKNSGSNRYNKFTANLTLLVVVTDKLNTLKVFSGIKVGYRIVIIVKKLKEQFVTLLCTLSCREL